MIKEIVRNSMNESTKAQAAHDKEIARLKKQNKDLRAKVKELEAELAEYQAVTETFKSPK